MSTEKYLDLLQKLEVVDGLLYEVFKLGEPVLTDSIRTACVAVVDGKIHYMFNKEFYEKNSLETNAFVIAHETLHVVLMHGSRMVKYLKEKLPKDLLNVAADIIVNELLIRRFGFKEETLNLDFPLCRHKNWVPECEFDPTVHDLDWYVHYLKSKLKEAVAKIEASSSLAGPGGIVEDSHDGLEEVEGEVAETLPEVPDDIKKESAEKLGNTSEADSQQQQAGKSPLGNLFIVPPQRVKPKRKWESIILGFNRIGRNDDYTDDWKVLPKRMWNIDPLSLPGEMEVETFAKDKWTLALFIDASGSCNGYHERFIKCARSLDPNKFIVQAFSFDTQIYPIDIVKGTIRGGGGTRFDIMEQKCQEMEKYPFAVFVITDGYGSNITPEFPKRWYWFLTTNSRSCIPNESKVFYLKDFE